MSNLRQFANADQMYVSQYNYHMPPVAIPQRLHFYKYYWPDCRVRKAMACDHPGSERHEGYTPTFEEMVLRKFAGGFAFAPDRPDPDTKILLPDPLQLRHERDGR